MSRRLVIIVRVRLALVAGAFAGWRMTQPETPLARALSITPADTGRVSWTDWDAVRRTP